MSYEHLITVEPDKRSGKPCIRGLRITVYDILEYLAAGMTEDQILSDFSELTRDDIRACLVLRPTVNASCLPLPREAPPR
jgi:uncharacterized protein (DUF433 family)